jgi:hypothetical protein
MHWLGLYIHWLGEHNMFWAQFLAGGTAGVLQWLPPIYFTDIIKSRMQTADPGTYSGIIDCTRKVYLEGGSSIFFRGMTPALLRAFPLHAIIFLVYEETKLRLLSLR